MKGCRTCPNDNCIDCFGDDTIDYSNTIDEETFRNEIKIQANIQFYWIKYIVVRPEEEMII